MNERRAQLKEETLFVGATRPAMRWGVTYAALMSNLVMTMEAFLITRNLLTLLLCLPAHGLCVLLCGRDARIFELAMLWARTRLPAAAGNLRFWKASSYGALDVSVADQRGGRRPRASHCIAYVAPATPRVAP